MIHFICTGYTALFTRITVVVKIEKDVVESSCDRF
jgi:hypothetical protein